MLKKTRMIYSQSKFSRNTAPKILSLLFAVIFWIFVMDNVNPEMTKTIDDVQVQLIGVSELEAKDYVVMGEREFFIDVTITGRRNEVLKLSEEDIQLSADLGELSNGLQVVPVKRRLDVEEVTIDALSMTSIAVDVDAIIRKPIDVRIDIEGDVPTGYYAENKVLSLTQIFIKGPETYVNMVSELNGKISINNATDQISKDLAVLPLDKNGETVTGIEVETDYVTVTIPVSKNSSVAVEPSFDGSVKDGYELVSVTVEPEVINVRGSRDDINALKYIETDIISLGFADEDFEVSTNLDIPTGIVVNQYLDDVIVKFEIEEIITKEFTFDYSDITFLNMNSDYRTNINEFEGQVLLRVSARESIINDLSKNDLGLYIEAEALEVGEVVSKIALNKSNDFKVIEVVPETLMLTIRDINDEPDPIDTTEDETNETPDDEETNETTDSNE